MLGLFSGELIFGGAYYWKEFWVSKWIGCGNKNSLKHYDSLEQLKTASTNSPWAYRREGLLWDVYLRLRFGGLFSGGLIFGRRDGVFSVFYSNVQLSTGITISQNPTTFFRALAAECLEMIKRAKNNEKELFELELKRFDFNIRTSNSRKICEFKQLQIYWHTVKFR